MSIPSYVHIRICIYRHTHMHERMHAYIHACVSYMYIQTKFRTTIGIHPSPCSLRSAKEESPPHGAVSVSAPRGWPRQRTWAVCRQKAQRPICMSYCNMYIHIKCRYVYIYRDIQIDVYVLSCLSIYSFILFLHIYVHYTTRILRSLVYMYVVLSVADVNIVPQLKPSLWGCRLWLFGFFIDTSSKILVLRNLSEVPIAKQPYMIGIQPCCCNLA